MGKSDRQAIRVGIEMLRGARSVLAIPGAWGRGWYAFDEAGGKVQVSSDEAVRFCAMGALSKIVRSASDSDLKNQGYIHALQALPESSIDVNDDSETVGPILDMFDRAIAKLEGELVYGKV